MFRTGTKGGVYAGGAGGAEGEGGAEGAEGAGGEEGAEGAEGAGGAGMPGGMAEDGAETTGGQDRGRRKSEKKKIRLLSALSRGIFRSGIRKENGSDRVT